MIINIPESIQDICYQGDLHGAFELTIYHIKKYNIYNTLFIVLGDCGYGFESLEHYTNNIIPKLTKTLKKHSCSIFYIAGNHDNRKYYNEQLINTEYVKTIPDYSIIKGLGHNILCISGATSIDRTSRIAYDNREIIRYMQYHNCNYKEAEQKARKTYWEDEAIVYQPKVEESIDIICSHSAPSFCYPYDKGSIVQAYAEYDSKLIEDITKERQILDKVYEDYKDTLTHWYYGHFHQSNMETINGVMFKLLNIGEICRHVNSDLNG